MTPPLPRVDSSAILAPRPSNPPLPHPTPTRHAAWWFVEYLVQHKLLEIWALEIEQAAHSAETILTADAAAERTSWLDSWIGAAQARVETLRSASETSDVFYMPGCFVAMRRLNRAVHAFVKRTVEGEAPVMTFASAVDYHARLRALIAEIDPVIEFPDEREWFCGADAAVWTAELEMEFGPAGGGKSDGVGERGDGREGSVEAERRLDGEGKGLGKLEAVWGNGGAVLLNSH